MKESVSFRRKKKPSRKVRLNDSPIAQLVRALH